VTEIRLDGRLLNAREVGELLGIPRSTVYELVRRTHDPLPVLRIGRHLRWTRALVEAWLARQLEASR
jgi:excisionase family DNA binding protein